MSESKERLVKPQEDTVIEYTEKAKHHKKGDRATVHKVTADNLVAKGFAKIVEVKPAKKPEIQQEK